MKIIFSLLGIFIGASVDEWPGAVFGLFIGLLAGTLIQLKDRIKKIEEGMNLIRANLVESSTESKPSEEKGQESEENKPHPEPEQAPTVETISPLSVTEKDAADIPATVEASLEQEWTRQTTEGPAAPPIDFINRGIAWLKRYFTTGNVVVKVGVIVLFFGIGFLLKYAAERNAFPIELRLAAVAVAGIVMLISGWRLRHRNRNYALVLQGGAVGVLYLTVFAAAKIYTVVPLLFAFGVMFTLVVFSCFIAVLQDSRSLACFATIGGFLAPVLTSSGTGNHVALFSYYALLNFGILGIAWYRAWRILNWIGFVFTFVIASLWGYQNYQPQFFTTTEPFLVLFFIFYLAITILYAHRQPPELKGLVDGSLVFGVPLVGFTLQGALVSDYEFGLALSSLGIGVIYILLAKVLWNRQVKGMRMLTEAFLSLGVIFTSMAVPFALDGHWTAAAWALEGAGMTWIGIRQNRLLPRCFGLILHVGGGMAFLLDASVSPADIVILNSAYLGSVIVSLAGLFTACLISRYKTGLRSWEHSLELILIIWGLLWWFGAGLAEIERQVSNDYEFNSFLGFIALSFMIIFMVASRVKWEMFKQPPVLLLPAMVMFSLVAFIDSSSLGLLNNYGYVFWIITFSVQYLLLYRSEKTWNQSVMKWWHCGTMWLLVFMLSWFAVDVINRLWPLLDIWANIMWGFIPAVAVFLLLLLKDSGYWPFNPYKNYYLSTGLLPVIVYLVVWIFTVCFDPADPAPLPYVPVLNPQDIVQLFSMLMIIDWLNQAKTGWFREEVNIDTSLFYKIMAGVAFIWLTSVVAHSVHFYTGVRYSPDPMFHSPVFQTSISIVWTLTAFSIMGVSSRMGKRNLWVTGAALLAVVVIKLFIIDIADTGTITQIVSFITVGFIMLIIGYISPVPPRQIEQENGI